MNERRYPVYRERLDRVDYAATVQDAIFAQRLEAFVRKTDEVVRYKEWERTPLLDRLRHALHATLPDAKDRR